MICQLKLENTEEIKRAYELVVQLRTHINFETYEKLLKQMTAESYELWAYEDQGVFKGILGMRLYTDFVRGAHLYIDDLVVDVKYRSQKIGAKLLAFAEEEAKKRKLPSLRLACALANTGGMKFYEREAWTRRSYGYVKKVS